MDFVYNFIKFYFIFVVIKMLIKSIFRIKIVRPKVVNDEVEASSKFQTDDIKETAIDLVLDEMCNTYVPKNKAYQVVGENTTHFFCSWECREKFINTNN